MLFSTFDLSKKFFYYKGGELVTNRPWMHEQIGNVSGYELIFCLKGSIFLNLNEKDTVIKKHEVLIIPPNSSISGYKNSEIGTDFYWINFIPENQEKIIDIPSEDIDTRLEPIGISKDNQTLLLPLHFKINNFNEFNILIHQLLGIKEERPYLDERDYMLSILLIKLFYSYTGRIDEHPDALKVTLIQEWIRANMSKNLTVESIANAQEISPDYLTRLFKKVTGMTTLQYLNKIKVETAISLLLRTNMSVKQIANSTYFRDSRTFMRRFKALTGLTPSQYRKANKSVHLNNQISNQHVTLSQRKTD